MSTNALLKEGKHKLGPYVIYVHNDDDFDRLPVKHAKVSFGYAEKDKDTIHIRKTNWGPASDKINLLTLEHEIDEILAKTSPHEEDGIRYKKLSEFTENKWVRGIATVGATLINPGLGALVAGSYATRDVTKRGASPWSIPLSAGGAYMGGTAFQGAGGLSGMLNSGAAAMPGSTAGMFAGGAGGGSAVGSMAAPSYLGANSLLMGASAGMGTMAAGAGNQQYGIQTMALNKVLPGAAKSAASEGGFGSYMEMLNNPMAKLGMGNMAATALAPSPEIPELGDIVGKWLTADTVTKAGAKARGMAEIQYGGEWQPDNETNAFIDVMEKDIRKAYKKRREDTDKSSMRFNEQWMRSGERLELMRSMEEEEQQEVDRMSAQWLFSARQQHSTRQYNYIMSELKVDDAVKRDLLYADLAEVLWKYNMERDEVMNFREIAAQAGIYDIRSDMGMFQTAPVGGR